MRAFLGVIWNSEDKDATAKADWFRGQIRLEADAPEPIARNSGFLLYNLSNSRSSQKVESPGPLCEDKRIAIFGTLFDRSSFQYQSPTKLGPHSVCQLIVTRGQSFVSDYWGSYVAFISLGGSTHVVTDPMSSYPCFYTTIDGVTLVFSHLEKCTFLKQHAFTVNYDFLAQSLVYDKIQNGDTGLNEVRELICGQRLNVTDGKASTDVVWDPRAIAQDSLKLEASTAAEYLRETVWSVVRARSSEYKRLTLNLSGGLDSTIVLSCLTGCDTPFQAVHQKLLSDDTSELQFAKLACDAFGCPLVVIETQPCWSLPFASEHPLSARPHRSFASEDWLGVVETQVQNVGDALFSGQGGDHLFFGYRGTEVLADYVLAHGFDGHFVRECLQTARLSGKSVYGTVRDILPYLFGEPAKGTVATTIAQRTTSVSRLAFDLSRPTLSLPEWVTDARGLPPAKFRHVNGLFHLIHMREVLDRSGQTELVHPLISQPLIELCLRLPSYQLALNGESRGLARTAFESQIPKAIRNRHSKASASRYVVDFIDYNREQIIETLRQGKLVEHGLIDEADVESFLSQKNLRFGTFRKMAMIYYSVEGWLSAWDNQFRRNKYVKQPA